MRRSGLILLAKASLYERLSQRFGIVGFEEGLRLIKDKLEL